MRNIIVALLAVVCSGCAVNASGPGFNTVPRPPIAGDEIRIYAFRERVLYLVQAPHVVRAALSVDGRTIGHLVNGSFLIIDVPAGRHSVGAASGADQTVKIFDAPTGAEVFVEVWDKTRMEGVPALAAGAAGGAVGGAIIGAAQSASAAEGEGRIWGVGFVSKQDAWPVLQGLSLSK